MKFCITLIFSFAFAGIQAQPIDLQWVKGIGGTFSDEGHGVTADSSGNVYVTGTFRGMCDVDPGQGVLNFDAGGFSNNNMFIVKLSPAGDLIWAKQSEGATNTNGQSIAVDAAGNVYVTGWFSYSTDFDPGPGVVTLSTGSSAIDVFILKLDASGNFVWVKSFGNPAEYDEAYSLTLDSSENVYVVGAFYGTVDFDPNGGSYIVSSVGYRDLYLLKLDPAGNFVYVKTIGGLYHEYARCVEVDAADNIYITGAFNATVDFDPGPGVYDLTSAGGTYGDDIFALKLDASGDFVWAKHLGGSGSKIPFGIAVSSKGEVAFTGNYTGSPDLDPGPAVYTLSFNGIQDGFIAKLDSAGNFAWAKQIGGVGTDNAAPVKFDKSGNVYFSGFFDHTVDFDPGTGGCILTTAGNYDVYIVKLDSAGNFKGAARAGGVNGDFPYDICVDASDNIYAVGAYGGVADFSASVALNSAGATDAYVEKLRFGGILEPPPVSNPLLVYPNPLHQILMLQKSGYNILSFTDVLGQEVMTVEFHDSLELDVLSLANGIYFLKDRSTGEVVKLIKQ